MKNYGNIFKFLRDKDIIHRRTKINEIGFQVNDQPYLRHYSVGEVTKILNNAGIDVGMSTVRRWIRISLLKAFKKSKRKSAKWWMMKCHIRELQRRMHKMSEAYEEYREKVKKERKRRPRYVTEESRLPRDRHGRFVSEKKNTEPLIDHRNLMPHLG